MHLTRIMTICFLFLSIADTHARKPLKRKPFNGYYFFSESNYSRLRTVDLNFGAGKFKTKCKGFEISSTIKVFSYDYEALPPFRIGVSINKFHRKLIGRRSSSIGYRIGLNYTQVRAKRQNIRYSDEAYEYSLRYGFYVSNQYMFNCETFWNKRLFGRVYFELKFGVQNGIENIQYSNSEIISKSLNYRPSTFQYWGNKGPGTYLRTNTNFSARLLFCFGKAKK